VGVSSHFRVKEGEIREYLHEGGGEKDRVAGICPHYLKFGTSEIGGDDSTDFEFQRFCLGGMVPETGKLWKSVKDSWGAFAKRGSGGGWV